MRFVGRFLHENRWPVFTLITLGDAKQFCQGCLSLRELREAFCTSVRE
jgi:hypothetical protein